MKLYTLEFNCNTPTTQQVNIPTNSDFKVGIKVTKNGEVLDIAPAEMTLGGEEADVTKTNGYVTFTMASGDNANYESKVVAIEMEDGFRTTFTLNINVYKSQQGDIGVAGSGGGVTEQWVQDYVSAETSAFVTDTDMGTAISNATTDMATETWVGGQISAFVTSTDMGTAISTATTDMATQTWVGQQNYATSAYVDAQIGNVLNSNF